MELKFKKGLFIRRSLLFFLLLIPFRFFASTDYTVETVPNVRLTDRYNHVSNPDGIIQPNDVQRINGLLQAVEDSLGIEIAVVAIESIGDSDARMFATDLFKKWGLGEKNKNNGLLIQLVTEPSQRSVVFETGYGLEGILPDAICYRLQQQHMIPDLKAGNYSTGMVKGIAAVKKYLMSANYERTTRFDQNQNNTDEELSDILFIFLFLFGTILFIIVYTVFRHRTRICPRCGQKTLAYAGERIIQKASYSQEGLAEEIWRCKNCGYTEKKNRHIDKLHRSTGPVIIGGGGLGRGSGGFGGGGGSWGGGSSGGGGSISRF